MFFCVPSARACVPVEQIKTTAFSLLKGHDHARCTQVHQLTSGRHSADSKRAQCHRNLMWQRLISRMKYFAFSLGSLFIVITMHALCGLGSRVLGHSTTTRRHSPQHSAFSVHIRWSFLIITVMANDCLVKHFHISKARPYCFFRHTTHHEEHGKIIWRIGICSACRPSPRSCELHELKRISNVEKFMTTNKYEKFLLSSNPNWMMLSDFGRIRCRVYELSKGAAEIDELIFTRT